MEILNIKHTETNKTKNTRHSTHNSGRHANRRQKRLRGNSGISTASSLTPVVHATAVPSTSSGKSTGILQSLSAKLKGEDRVQYVALNQTELEKGLQQTIGSEDESDRQSFNSSSNGNTTSSEEDLFATSSRRRLRRKMTRKGTYSMRETFENSRQVSNAK